MPEVVGVKLKYAGKVLWFDPAGTSPAEGDFVVVSTERGQEFGQVVMAPRNVEDSELPAGLKPVLRVADEKDVAHAEVLTAREREDMEKFRELVDKHKLDMKPIGAERLFDDSKVVFYFAAEERVDFRELVRELAAELRSHVDVRQVGVRDEARMVGGLGHCGQPLCCVRFTGDFQPVSIRMAKEQDLPLNPLKISGLCGRLMCCLRYEFEAYKDFKQRAPRCGTQVDLPDGTFGKIASMDVPRERLTIRQQGGPEITVPLEALDCSAGRGCPCKLKADAVPVEQDSTSMLRGTMPTLREAERTADTSASPRPEGSRRRRQGPKPEGQPSAEAPKPQEQNGKQRTPRKRGPKPQVAPPASEAPTPTGGRRRRRRRPHADGGSTASE